MRAAKALLAAAVVAAAATQTTGQLCPEQENWPDNETLQEQCFEQLEACYDLNEVAPATETSNSIERIVVQAAGATFPLRLYQDAIFAYRFQNQSVSVSYLGTGSGSGKCRIKDFVRECDNACTTATGEGVDSLGAEYIDFAGSDSLLTEAEYDEYPDLQMYPAVAGAVVPIYNLAGLDDLGHTLVLNKTTLAQIFRKCDLEANCPGAIFDWNDPRIVELNYVEDDAALSAEIENVLTAAGAIEVTVRSDKSGTSEIFKGALSQFEEAFSTQVGSSSDNSDYNADVVKHDGNVGVAGHVANTPGAIGYSVLGEAITIGLSCASLKISEDSTAVEATTVSVANAMVEKGLDFGTSDEDQLRLNADISDATGSQAWPIAGYTYFVVRKNTTRPNGSCENRLATQNFILWFYENEVPQAIAESLGFAPLSDEVRKLVVSRVQQDIYCEGELVYKDEEEEVPTISYAGASAFEDIFSQYQLSYAIVEPDTEFNDTFVETDSLAAVNRINDETTTIAVTLSSNTAATARVAELPGVVSVPYVGVALGVSVNFCSSDASASDAACEAVKEVNMTVSVLGRILMGDISAWDHADILALNPGIDESHLTGQSITVYGQADEGDELYERFVTYVREMGGLTDFTGVVPAVSKSSLEAVRSAVATKAFSIAYNPVIGDANQREAFFVSVGSGTGSFLEPVPSAIVACATDDAYDSSSGALDLSVGATAAASGCYPLVDTMNLVVRSKFTSSAGECSGGIGTVNAEYIGFLLNNVLQEGADSSVEEPLVTQGLLPVSTLDDARIQKNKEILTSITCDGLSILNPTLEKNLIPVPVVVLSFVLVLLFFISFIVLAFWVQKHRRQKIILISSPPFLLQILLGATICVAAIIPLSLQDDGVFYSENADENGNYPGLDIACAAAPLLYSVGFAVLYSSLWLKTWRLGRIFDNPKLKRIFITNRTMQLYQGLLLTVILVCNILWMVIDPLRYERVVVTMDDDGSVLESYGRCYSEDSLILIAPLAAILMLSLLYGIYLLYQSRRIPSEYGEGRYIGFSLTMGFESLLLGIPVLFLAGNNPTTSFVVKMAIIIFTSAAVVGFLFLPKVWHVYSRGWSTGLNSSDSDQEYSFTHSKPRLQDNAMQSTSFIDSFKDHTRSFMEPSADADNEETV
ncbi:Metabotropic glutamate receptor-like protein B [Hondaea fermentalgiana]|uniref:Metabotropic glutamate receptor-like protein B n=1 Tax=Hondaea fermentalgiana TaxID=2315210 RepID=A0A2R5GXV6_9STRA|nr:Metabotropic glutamate receptor-like protein B [Hondaea fermentalgiana]|eukprot:GBG32804.1 Metabotropic glutamate receptor-like protein B [Hondaea fermentalgiana]